MEKIGLIAGNRKFPLLFAHAAKKRGFYVFAVAIKGDTSRRIGKVADEVVWLKISEYSRMFEIFKSAGISKVVMAGQISPARLFSKEIMQDAQLREILNQIKDKKADTIFGAIAKKMEASGLQLSNSISLMGDYLPAKGILSRREPTHGEWQDVHFGFDLAKEMGMLDIGQTVAVKERAVVAVEALEGTDNLIRRAGRIARRGAVIIKVSKPKQDLRFDIPVIGLGTIKNLVRIKASCLAIEAGKTIFIDRQKSLELSDSKNIAVVAV